MGRETAPKKPTDWDDYRFDLEGYLILKNAVDPETIKDINLKTFSIFKRLNYSSALWYTTLSRFFDPVVEEGLFLCFGAAIVYL